MDDQPVREERSGALKRLAGPMADLVRRHDWSSVSVGGIECWPRPIPDFVATMLASRQPMCVLFGPERIFLYNDAYAPILGARHPGALGRPMFEIWHEARAAMEPLVETGFAGESVARRDIALLLDRGGGLEEAHFAFSLDPIFGADGSAVGLLCPCAETMAKGTVARNRARMREPPRESEENDRRDPAWNHEAEERFQEIQGELLHMSRFNALGEMASALAHELNQPLAAIANYLDACGLLVEPLEGRAGEQLRGAIERAGVQTRRAGEIIRSLREFVTRGDARRRSESVPKLVEEASALALVGAREKGVRVTFYLPPDLPPVTVNRIQIQQVLFNLLRNAIEAMEDAPRRELTLQAAPGDGGGFVEIRVTDTGPGLAPEIAAALFQPFRTTKPNGMGVGLSICRTIVEAHGGRIAAHGDATGGTVFRFTVPI